MKRSRKSNMLMNARKQSGGFSAMRPFLVPDKNGDFHAYVSVHTGGSRLDKKNFKAVPVANAELRYDEWRTIDDAVQQVSLERLVGFDDLRRNGLVYTLNNAMGTTVLSWEEVSEAMEAQLSIDPVRRGNNDTVDFAMKNIPIPIAHSDYQISERILQESRNRGDGLDTVNAEAAARKVAEQLEDMLFGATSSKVYGGGTIYTYLTLPDRNQMSFNSARPSWGAAGKTSVQIVEDVIAMKQASITDKHFGEWMLYIPTAYDTIMDQDYSVSGESTQTIKQRIMKIAGIQGVSVVDRLTADNVLLVQMKKDTVDLIDGMPMQNVQWNTEGGFVHHYKVMTIQVPRIRSDYNNTSGVVHLS